MVERKVADRCNYADIKYHSYSNLSFVVKLIILADSARVYRSLIWDTDFEGSAVILWYSIFADFIK